jgi:hypothetical protein
LGIGDWGLGISDLGVLSAECFVNRDEGIVEREIRWNFGLFKGI